MHAIYHLHYYYTSIIKALCRLEHTLDRVLIVEHSGHTGNRSDIPILTPPRISPIDIKFTPSI
jgi:hypothetical protein